MDDQVLAKNKQKEFEILLLFNKTVNLKEMCMTWIRINFFPRANLGSGSASKLNGS